MRRLRRTVPAFGITTLFIISRSLFWLSNHIGGYRRDHCLHADHPGIAATDVLPDEDDAEDAGTDAEAEGPAEEVLVAGPGLNDEIAGRITEALQGSRG